MRFICLPGRTAPTSPEVSREWAAERRAGHQIGVISLGAEHLFFRKGLTAYVLPYGDISRYFRRVLAVPARIGRCAGGELRIEHLVLCAADAQGAETELAQIQLPGERAAKAMMKELGRLAPNAIPGRPITSADASQNVSANASQASADGSQNVSAPADASRKRSAASGNPAQTIKGETA